MIKCYTDASYNPKTKTAISGYIIDNNPAQTLKITSTNNTRAEIIGLIKLIEQCEPDKKYIIFTDCQSILDRITKKNKLIERKFTNKKGALLSNADLYIKLFGLISSNIQLEHIRGHIPAHQMNENNIIFSKLDKLVRKKLRLLVS